MDFSYLDKLPPPVKSHVSSDDGQAGEIHQHPIKTRGMPIPDITGHLQETYMVKDGKASLNGLF